MEISYYSREDLENFLDELKLPKTEENIKWAFEMMIKQTKLDIKIRKFEEEYGWDDDCCCEDDECCGGKEDDCCCSSKASK